MPLKSSLHDYIKTIMLYVVVGLSSLPWSLLYFASVQLGFNHWLITIASIVGAFLTAQFSWRRLGGGRSSIPQPEYSYVEFGSFAKFLDYAPVVASLTVITIHCPSKPELISLKSDSSTTSSQFIVMPDVS